MRRGVEWNIGLSFGLPVYSASSNKEATTAYPNDKYYNLATKYDLLLMLGHFSSLQKMIHECETVEPGQPSTWGHKFVIS